MKKLILFSLLLASVMTACYDDYKTDFDYTATYFSYQYPIRTVVIDPAEDNFEFQVGAVYGGKYSYGGESETVSFEIDESLITGNTEITDMGIQLMPESWYTLSSESEIKMVNSNVGFVSVSINKEAMLANDDASQNTYAIPFKMLESTTDSILEGKDFSIVLVKFKNEFDGRYYVKGEDRTLNADGSVAETMVYSNDALVLNKYVFLNTIARDELSVPRIGGNEDPSKFFYTLKFNPENGSSVLTPGESSDITELVGAAAYDYASKSFVCNYNYKMSGVEHSVTDTLIYSDTKLELEHWMK